MKTTFYFAALAVLLAGCYHENGKTADSSAAESAAESGGESAAAPGDIVATVNGAPIPKARIEVYASAGGGRDTEAVVENMITSELLAQEARKAGMDKEPEISEQLAVAEQTVLGRAYTQKFLAESPVDEEAVRARYDELKTRSEKQSEYRTSHILLEDEARAKELHAEIAADGGKFAALAQEHSIDSGSSGQGGDLGWVNPDALVPEYGAALAATEPGNLAAEPVKTQFGWHIIYVAEKRPVAVPDLNDDLRARLRQAVRAETFARHIEELRGKASIVKNL